MSKNNIIAAFFILLLAAIFYEAFIIFSPFMPVIFFAALLAFGFYPLYQLILKGCGSRENVAASLTVLCILLAVAPLTVIVVFNMSSEIMGMFQKAVDFVAGGHLRELLDKVRSVPVIQRVESKLFSSGFLEESLHDWLVNMVRSLGHFSLQQFGVITRNLVYFSLGFLLTLLLVFAFLKNGAKIYRFIFEITPLEAADKKAIFDQIRETSEAVIRGQIVTSIVQSVCAGLVFYLMGLPVPLFIAASTFLSSMIPVVGASMVWAPFVLYLILKQQVLKALILLALGAFLISGVDNFLKPAIIGEKTKLPYFLLFLGILGGMKAYGFLGLFIAPVIMSLFFAIIKIYREKYLPDS